jgi:phospholipid N-methyltransferase
MEVELVSRKSPQLNYLLFLLECLKHYSSTGAIAPDSLICVNDLLKSIPFKSTDLILEYGAASGAVTREILLRKSPGSRLISFEKNRLFFEALGKNVRGSDVSVLNEDVFNAVNILSSRFAIKTRSVDCIVSTLPWSSMRFGDLIQRSVLPLLKAGGLFIQYMHSTAIFKGSRLRPVLERYFSNVDSSFVFFNIPPTFVYTCSGLVPQLDG